MRLIDTIPELREERTNRKINNVSRVEIMTDFFPV